MKLKPLIQLGVMILTMATLATLNWQLSTARAQGTLTPPGPPVPSMRTLDQIEPRTPISQANVPLVITAPGSYVLTGNLQATATGMDVITIQSDDVTLDLNGFTIHGAGLGASAIEVSGTRQSIVIRNGTVRDFTAPAILGINGRNMQCSGIKALNAVAGIVVGDGSQVIDCQVANHTFSGIDLRGPHCQVRNCIVSDANTGIVTSDGTRVEGCTVSGGSTGIQVRSDCDIRGTTFRSNGTACVAQGNGSRIAENQCLDFINFGFFMTGTGNRLDGNIVKGSGDHYNITQGNQLNLLLSRLPETIDWPASVKLAGTLIGVSGSNGITVTASDVTLDLGGHALVGVPGSLAGIVATSGVENVEIRNGSIVAWGAAGVEASAVAGGHYRDLRVTGNGHGLLCGNNSIIVNCTTKPNAGQNLMPGFGSMVGPLTKEQVEPRIPISTETTPGDEDSSFKITTAGSYYLTGNLLGAPDKHGIEIIANNVTLDLMGFEMRGRTVVIPPNGPSLSGVYVSEVVTNLCVRNGSINNWGQTGVRAVAAFSSRFLELQLTRNLYGLTCGWGTVISGCNARENRQDGLETGTGCTVINCTAIANQRFGLTVFDGGTASQCTAMENGTAGIWLRAASAIGCNATWNHGDGIRAQDSTVSHCTANGNYTNGISAVASLIRDCTASNNDEDGFELSGSCHVTGCLATKNLAHGFYISGNGTRIDGNTASHNKGRGFVADPGLNLVTRNQAVHNSTSTLPYRANFLWFGANEVGTLRTSVSEAGPWDNFDLFE